MTFLNIDDIDKTIYEHLRREVVRLGYLPDILSPNYTQERISLKASLPKKQLIDVFAPAPWQSRDMKELSRFVIDRIDMIKGKIGGWAVVEEKYVENGVTKIRTYKTPDKSKTLVYEIRFATDNVKYELLAYDIIERVFGLNKSILCLSERGGTEPLEIRIVWKGEYNASKFDFYERVFTFHVEDIFLESSITEVVENQSLIVEIQADIKENNQIVVTQIVN